MGRIKINFSKINLPKITALLCCVFLVFCAVIFCLPNFASAQVSSDQLGLGFGSPTGLTTTDIRIVIANIIRIALGLIGIVFVVLIIYAGVIWMTAEGDKAKVDKSKKIITNAVIGLIIILMAFAITQFIFQALLGQNGGGVGTVNGSGGNGFGGGAYGSGTVQSHYPERDQLGVPRNTSIAITFKVSYDGATIGSQACDLTSGVCGTLNPNVKIFQLTEEQSGPGKTIDPNSIDSASLKTNINVYSVDNKTFSFRLGQGDLFGNPNNNTWYGVYLSNGVKMSSGESGFGTASTYGWSFEVSTELDLTPPQIISVSPYPGSEKDRNAVIQIFFNEPIDPTTTTGLYKLNDPAAAFDKISVSNGSSRISGSFNGANNQYQTTEFITDSLCGTNSCGENVYCLPGNTTISTNVRAAVIDAVLGSPVASFPFTGIVDFAGNSLDGNKDGNASGPQDDYNLNNPVATEENDNVKWTFQTTNEINLLPPVIESIFPGNDSDSTQGVTLSTMIDIYFSKLMRDSSLNNSGLLIKIGEDTWENSFWVKSELLYDDENQPYKTKARIDHNDFSNETMYSPEANQNIQDEYQNCFIPSGDLNNCIADCSEITGKCVQGDSWSGSYPSCDLR